MTIEDTLRASLAERLDSLDTPPGDLAAALREGTRARRRRPVIAGIAAAACLAAVALTGVVLSTRDDSTRPEPAPAPSSGDWTRLPQAPLSPRANALTVWTGEEVLVFGGEVSGLCPPNADCGTRSTVARDGAAYDPESKTWRTLAKPPVDLLTATPHAMVGDLLVTVEVVGDRSGVEDRLFGYDVSDGTWRELPGTLPAGALMTGSPAVLDGSLLSAGSDRIVMVDPLTGDRRELPASPHRPSLSVESLHSTPEGLVALGLDATQPNDGIKPSLLLAEVWDGTSWRRLGPSEILSASGLWHWTGERLVAPYGECLDGGETNNYGRCIPTGGALDPATGTWEPLDQAPPTQDGWNLDAADGPIVATWGQLYDDRDQSWTELRRPRGAPSAGTSAVFGNGTLYAFGGVDWGRDLKGGLSGDAWAWTP